MVPPSMRRQPHVSFTQIDQYLRCPLKYRFTYVDRLKPEFVPAALALLLAGTPASADLRLCNMTSGRIGIALGYRDAQGWLTEGWWTLKAKECQIVLKGPLASRFYYVYAVDDRGEAWSGRSFMCTREREFTIRGTEDCLARGFDRNGFFEVDTQQANDWTIRLTDPSEGGAKAK